MPFLPEIKRTPSRFRNPLSKYKIYRGRDCQNCGLCAQLCPRGVHQKLGSKMLFPKDEFCQGPSCQKNDFFCITRCPRRALLLVSNPSLQTIKDYRWTPDLLMATWQQAETGDLPYTQVEYRVGETGGGFDRLRLRFPKKRTKRVADSEKISTSLLLNRRQDGRPQIEISVPFYGGGMSFGSVSLKTMLARAKAARKNLI